MGIYHTAFTCLSVVMEKWLCLLLGSKQRQPNWPHLSIFTNLAITGVKITAELIKRKNMICVQNLWRSWSTDTVSPLVIWMYKMGVGLCQVFNHFRGESELFADADRYIVVCTIPSSVSWTFFFLESLVYFAENGTSQCRFGRVFLSAEVLLASLAMTTGKPCFVRQYFLHLIYHTAISGSVTIELNTDANHL